VTDAMRATGADRGLMGAPRRVHPRKPPPRQSAGISDAGHFLPPAPQKKIEGDHSPITIVQCGRLEANSLGVAPQDGTLI
jgi:hypothetical protein